MTKAALLLMLLVPWLRAQDDTRSVWDGVYSGEQAKRGEPEYRKQCGTCHGDQMTGGEMAPPLAGGGFLANWNGLTLGDLLERIRKTMPSQAPGKLSRQVYVDILAHMLNVNEFPVGEKELPTGTEFLRRIRIESTKPEKK
jgi:mono/diheme cytochrome c family protein